MAYNKTRLAFMGGMVVGAILTAAVTHFVSVLPRDPCVHEVVREFPSPNGERLAEVVLTNCGATTRYATSVSVRNIGRKPDIDYVFSVEEKNDIEVIWDDNRFTIVYERPEWINRKVLTQLAQNRGVALGISRA